MQLPSCPVLRLSDRWSRFLPPSKLTFLNRVSILNSLFCRPISARIVTDANDPTLPDTESTHVLTVSQEFLGHKCKMDTQR